MFSALEQFIFMKKKDSHVTFFFWLRGIFYLLYYLIVVILFIFDSYNMWSDCMSPIIICHYQGELNYLLAVLFLVHIHNAWYIKHFLIF